MSVNVKNYKSFEQMESDIKKLNEKWKETTSNSDKVHTFAGIQQQMLSLHAFITNERKDLYDDIDKLKEVWSGKVIAEKKEKLTAQFDEMVKKIVVATKQDIMSLSSSKTEKIGDMLATAPTEEQLRLLSVLQMRNDLDPVEVHSILPVFFNNYQAIRVLQVISEQNGIHLYLPTQLDCHMMYDKLKEATDFLMHASDELPKKWENMPVQYHAFYTINADKEGVQYDPVYQQYINLFDNMPQLQEVKTEKQSLSKAETTRVNWYMRDVVSLDITNISDYTVILQKVADVMKSNPEVIDLLKLSIYKDFVADVEANTAE